MSRRKLIIERDDGYGTAMSPQGIQDLTQRLYASNPKIRGVIVEVDGDYELPTSYSGTEIDGTDVPLSND